MGVYLMAEIKQLFQLQSLPGIKRDGTTLDGDNYSDGQWVRFQRGRPKKIGGYVMATDQLRGPIYTSLVWSKSTLNNIFSFHKSGIEMIQVNQYGVGASVINRTPSGFTADDKILWSVDTMYDAAAGSEATLVLALPASLIGDLDDQTERPLYVGDAIGTGVFTPVYPTDSNAIAAGGVYVAGNYAVLYGKDGKVTWSNINEPQNYTTGDAGTARVTGSKIIKGMSLRSGGGSGGLLWSLDSVIRQDWIGGNAIFKFSTLSRQSSILSANSVVEYDGSYYWVGIDRFMMCNGSQVVEIPNDMNLNWFFDNLNTEQKSKVHAMKIPRYGEIWWFFPKGTNTECSHAVIFNVREKSWYDVELPRNSGYHQQVFNNPVMAGVGNNTTERVVVVSITSGSIVVGDTITGGTSTAIATVYAIGSDGLTCYVALNSLTELTVLETITASATHVALTAGTGSFVDGDTVTDDVTSASGTIYLVSTGIYHIIVTSGAFGTNAITNQTRAGTATITSVSACTATVSDYDTLYAMFIHERGHNAVLNENSLAIESWITSADIGLPTGGVSQSPAQGLNRWTRLVRVETDFLIDGEMTMEVLGKEFANSPETTTGPYTFDATTTKIDLRVQERHLRLKFTSNTSDGSYEMGKVILHTEPGDIRS